MDQIRRRVLGAASSLSVLSLGGCLSGDSGEDETAPDEQQTGSVSECTTDSVPTAFDQQVVYPFCTSHNSFSLTDRTAPTEPPCLAWEQPRDSQHSRVFTGPVVTTDHVISYDSGGSMTARRRADGTTAWNTEPQTSDATVSEPTNLGAWEGGVAFAGRNGQNNNLQLVASDSDGGTQVSQTVLEADGPNEADVLTGRLYDEKVYLAIADDSADQTSVTALEWPSGELIWQQTLGTGVLQLEDIAIDEETIVLTSDEIPDGSDNIWVLSRTDGSVRWSVRLPIGEALPVTDADHLYLPMTAYSNDAIDNSVRAFSKQTGEVVWEFEVTNPPRTGVSVDNDRVYIIADNQLSAVDSGDGSIDWEFTPDTTARIDGDSNGLATVYQDTLLLGSEVTEGDNPAQIRALDKHSGEQLWSVQLPVDSVQSPLVADGMLYATAEKDAERGRDTVLYGLY